MNKIIFQLALLGFFISMVLFGITSMPLLEVMVKAFVVCISIILGGIAIITIVRFSKPPDGKNKSPETGEGHETPKQQSMNQVKAKDPAAGKNTYNQKQKEKPLPA